MQRQVREGAFSVLYVSKWLDVEHFFHLEQLNILSPVWVLYVSLWFDIKPLKPFMLQWALSCHSKVHEVEHFCHTGNNRMVYHQCQFCRVTLNGLKLNIFCHTWSNRMIFHCCVFFHVSSNCLMLRTGSN